MFGKLTSILSNRSDIPLDEDTVSGKEFKRYVIDSICRASWESDYAVSLLAALR